MGCGNRLSDNLGASSRRKRQNLTDIDPDIGGGVTPGGPSDDDDSGGGGSSSEECGGGLLRCEALAEAEVCTPDSIGDYAVQIGCTLDILDVDLEEGDQIAWAADVKVSTSAGEEVNGTGTLKKDGTGLLDRDPLSSLADVSIENGDAQIVNGKLSLSEGDNDLQFTGFAARDEMVVQLRLQGGDFTWVSPRVMGRLTGTLDGYGVQTASVIDTLDRITGGTLGAQLDSAPRSEGQWRLTSERVVVKLYVADGVQKGRADTDVSSQVYNLSGTDTVHNGQTGVAGLVSTGSKDRLLAWDLIVCAHDTITVTGLPTDYSIRVGSLTASESSGTATLDLEGTLYPSAFALEILDDNGIVVDEWNPPSGIYGGDSFEYDELGGLAGDPEFDALGRVDLDFFDSAGVLLSSVEGPTRTQPTYKRLTGTTTVPVGTQFISPVMRREGTASSIVCSRRVAIARGTNAPWVPCEEVDDSARQVADRGKVILNPNFNELAPGGGSYWATHPESTGTPDSENPTLGGGVDFAFDGDGQTVDFVQVLNADDDFTKAPGDEASEATGGGSTEPDVVINGVSPVLRIRGDNISGLGDGASVTTQFKNLVTDTSSAVFNGDPKYVANAYNGHAGVRFERATPDILEWGLSYFDDGMILMVYVAEDDPSAEVCVASLTNGTTRNNWLHRLSSLQSHGMRYGGEGAKAANGSTARYDPNLTIQGAAYRSGITEYAYDGQAEQEVDGWIGGSLKTFDKIHVGGAESVAAGGHFDGIVLELLVWDGSFGSGADHSHITRLLGELHDYYHNIAVPPLSGAGTRLFPVTNEDVIAFAAEFVKENPGDGTGLELYVREYDENKVQLGDQFTILDWDPSEDGSRKQKTWQVGRLQGGDVEYLVRYISFHGQATGDTGETSHLSYWWGWMRPHPFKLSGILSLDGSNVDFKWRTHIPAKVKFVANTSGFLDYEDVEATGAFTETTELEGDTEEDVLAALSGRGYVSAVPYDREDRRSGEILHLFIDN